MSFFLLCVLSLNTAPPVCFHRPTCTGRAQSAAHHFVTNFKPWSWSSANAAIISKAKKWNEHSKVLVSSMWGNASELCVSDLLACPRLSPLHLPFQIIFSFFLYMFFSYSIQTWFYLNILKVLINFHPLLSRVGVLSFTLAWRSCVLFFWVILRWILKAVIGCLSRFPCTVGVWSIIFYHHEVICSCPGCPHHHYPCCGCLVIEREQEDRPHIIYRLINLPVPAETPNCAHSQRIHKHKDEEKWKQPFVFTFRSDVSLNNTSSAWPSLATSALTW